MYNNNLIYEIIFLTAILFNDCLSEPKIKMIFCGW